MVKKSFISVIALVLIAVSASFGFARNIKADGGQVNIWWPGNMAGVSGVQPFKAMLTGQSVDSYNMFWQVDNGQLNYMPTNYSDYPHKEVNVDLSGWHWHSDGIYKITFVAKDFAGNNIASQSVSIVTNPQPVQPVIQTQPAQQPVQQVQTQPTQTSVTATSPSSAKSIFSGAKLYVNPYSDAKNWANANRNNDPYNASLMDKIGNQPEVEWFGNWNSNIYNDVNNNVTNITNQGALPVMVAYNIPQRDCGSYSAGGSNDASAYQSWISDFARAIGNRKAAVILEPDALAQMTCLSQADQQTRISLLNYAVKTLKTEPQTAVYIDAGHSNWIDASTIANRLQQAGISQADGFSLNVSNFMSNSDSISYGTSISSMIGNKHFVIDTGRNGSGPTSDFQWCNPAGRSLGIAPTSNTGNSLVDAFLWVKGPGGSDGTCNGGPSAGVFWPQYALGLAQRTN